MYLIAEFTPLGMLLLGSYTRHSKAGQGSTVVIRCCIGKVALGRGLPSDDMRARQKQASARHNQHTSTTVLRNTSPGLNRVVSVAAPCRQAAAAIEDCRPRYARIKLQYMRTALRVTCSTAVTHDIRQTHKKARNKAIDAEHTRHYYTAALLLLCG